MSSSAGALAPAAAQEPHIVERLMRAFGAGATNKVSDMSTGGATAKAPALPPSDMVLLVGPAVDSVGRADKAADVVRVPVPAPAPSQQSLPAAPASMAKVVAASAPWGQPMNSMAGGSAAPAQVQQQQGPPEPPKLPLHELVELPGALGFLPQLPGMQPLPLGGPGAGLAAGSGTQPQATMAVLASTDPTSAGQPVQRVNPGSQVSRAGHQRLR